MKTSRRRPPAIAWAIAAASLCAAIGTGFAAPAGADDSARGGDVKPGPADPADPAGGAGSRRHTRDQPAPPADGGGWHPCRPIPPVPPPLPITPVDGRGDSGFIAMPATTPVAPVPVFGGGVRGGPEFPEIPVIAASGPVVPAPAAGPPPAVPPPRPAAVAPPRQPVAAPVALPRAVPLPPAAPPSPPRRAEVAGEPTAPVRLGHPEADLARALAAALPGLAAMAGLTAIGGVAGYRQARAGYLLRAAGAGRFLR